MEEQTSLGLRVVPGNEPGNWEDVQGLFPHRFPLTLGFGTGRVKTEGCAGHAHDKKGKDYLAIALYHQAQTKLLMPDNSAGFPRAGLCTCTDILGCSIPLQCSSFMRTKRVFLLPELH